MVALRSGPLNLVHYPASRMGSRAGDRRRSGPLNLVHHPARRMGSRAADRRALARSTSFTIRQAGWGLALENGILAGSTPLISCTTLAGIGLAERCPCRLVEPRGIAYRELEDRDFQGPTVPIFELSPTFVICTRTVGRSSRFGDSIGTTTTT